MNILTKIVNYIPRKELIALHIIKNSFTEVQLASLKRFAGVEVVEHTGPAMSLASFVKNMLGSVGSTLIIQDLLIFCANISQKAQSHIYKAVHPGMTNNFLFKNDNILVLSPVSMFFLLLPIAIQIYYGIINTVHYRRMQPTHKTVTTILSLLVSIGFGTILLINYLLMDRLKALIFVTGSTQIASIGICVHLVVFYSYVLLESFKLYKNIENHTSRKITLDVLYMSALVSSMVLVSLYVGIEGASHIKSFVSAHPQ